MDRLFNLIGYAYANYRHCSTTNNHNEDELLLESVGLIEEILGSGEVDFDDKKIVQPLLDEIKAYLKPTYDAFLLEEKLERTIEIRNKIYRNYIRYNIIGKPYRYINKVDKILDSWIDFVHFRTRELKRHYENCMNLTYDQYYDRLKVFLDKRER